MSERLIALAVPSPRLSFPAAVSFEHGRPFTPYQQLLGVLPSASANHLPAPYQRLMVEGASPIKDFYPEKVRGLKGGCVGQCMA
jgi:5'-3' exonuclease